MNFAAISCEHETGLAAASQRLCCGVDGGVQGCAAGVLEVCETILVE